MAEKTPKQLHNTLIGNKIVKSLEKRNFEAYYCETTSEALKKVLEIIPEDSTVSWGGSVTIREMGLTKALNEGNYNAIDRDKGANPDEVAALHRKGLLADYFVTSTNSITEDGILVNIDGTGNRLAAMCFGPKFVVVVCGINKVACNEEAALQRVRTYASPVNAMRFMGNTPCVHTGACGNCTSDDCICNQILTTRMSRPKNRIKVIMVGEEIGF